MCDFCGSTVDVAQRLQKIALKNHRQDHLTQENGADESSVPSGIDMQFTGIFQNLPEQAELCLVSGCGDGVPEGLVSYGVVGFDRGLSVFEVDPGVSDAFNLPECFRDMHDAVIARHALYCECLFHDYSSLDAFIFLNALR